MQGQVFDADFEETNHGLGGVTASPHLDHFAETERMVSDEVTPKPLARSEDAPYKRGVRCLDQSGRRRLQPGSIAIRHPRRPGLSIEVPGAIGRLDVGPPTRCRELEG